MHALVLGLSPGYQHYKLFIALAVPLISMASVVQTIQSTPASSHSAVSLIHLGRMFGGTSSGQCGLSIVDNNKKRSLILVS